MSKFVHSTVLDNGLQRIKDTCNKLLLINNYTIDDSYAVVTNAANVLAEVAMSSTDFTLSSNGLERLVTSATGKQDISANNGGEAANNHFAFIDTVNSRVLWVTNETSGQVIISGNGINFPALSLTFNQPT